MQFLLKRSRCEETVANAYEEFSSNQEASNRDAVEYRQQISKLAHQLGAKISVNAIGIDYTRNLVPALRTLT